LKVDDKTSIGERERIGEKGKEEHRKKRKQK
jgi:hypothetical protein